MIRWIHRSAAFLRALLATSVLSALSTAAYLSTAACTPSAPPPVVVALVAAEGGTSLDTDGGTPLAANRVPPLASDGGARLSPSDMNLVVAEQQRKIRQRCWQPAVDSLDAGTLEARVTVTVVIGASGNVESSSASGAEADFPGLSSCINGLVKGWKFPVSSGATRVTIPFVFRAQ